MSRLTDTLRESSQAASEQPAEAVLPPAAKPARQEAARPAVPAARPEPAPSPEAAPSVVTQPPEVEVPAEFLRYLFETVRPELLKKMPGLDHLCRGECELQVRNCVVEVLDDLASRGELHGHGAPDGLAEFIAKYGAGVIRELEYEFAGYGPIEPLLRDPDIEEIMVNGPDEIFVVRSGQMQLAPRRFLDKEHWTTTATRLTSTAHLQVNEMHPLGDGAVLGNMRLNIVLPPVSADSPLMTLRMFPKRFDLDALIEGKTLSREIADFLRSCVKRGLNLIVSGGTGSGKTTLLSALASEIPETQRVVVIEDTPELQIERRNLPRLRTRSVKEEGTPEISIRDLIKNALRMRPDRIVVGEVRGAEAFDMLQAMNTGHQGSLTTIHSNNPVQLLQRLEVLVLMAGYDLSPRAIRPYIASAIQLIVQLNRLPSEARRVTRITEVSADLELKAGTDPAFRVHDIFTLRSSDGPSDDAASETPEWDFSEPVFTESSSVG
ncbi:MAG: CpaF family protein [Candidatus Riflebacteria bacterium]|nr:CpaF family protein [Candidatus Riflebacteria bacterium]